MHRAVKYSLIAGGLVAAWEVGWWGRRFINRRLTFSRAAARARELGRPLVVVGAPDLGPTSGYPCGDVTLDIRESACPNSLRTDITKTIPFEDASCVVFVSCVLEYVLDLPAAIRELCRVSGGELFIVRVEPWTIASRFYPGARNRLPSALVRSPCTAFPTLPAAPVAPLVPV